MPKKTARKKTTKTKKTMTRGRKTTKKPTSRMKKKGAADYIISKTRTKAHAGINVSSDFYGALDTAVRKMISSAEARAWENGRKTLRPHDL